MMCVVTEGVLSKRSNVTTAGAVNIGAGVGGLRNGDASTEAAASLALAQTAFNKTDSVTAETRSFMAKEYGAAR
jgi:hypothetical protein